MECSTEISMYPLNLYCKPAISNFIKRLNTVFCYFRNKQHEYASFFCDYKRVMNAINTKMKNTFKNEGKVVFNMKIVKSKLSDKSEF